MHPLLTHVANEPCDDPDCEIHQIAVGLDEGTVNAVNLAFFIAGAQAMELAMRHELRAMGGCDRAAVRDASLFAGRPILALADRFA